MSSEAGWTPLELSNAVLAAPSLSAFHPVLPRTLLSTEFLRPKYNHSKAERELGIVFTPLEKSMVDMATYLVEKGVVAPPA